MAPAATIMASTYMAVDQAWPVSTPFPVPAPMECTSAVGQAR